MRCLVASGRMQPDQEVVHCMRSAADRRVPRRLVSCCLKRFIDLLVAGVSLVLLSPLLAIVSLLVLADVGRPILFVQIRPGKNGKPFPMYKFRTMNDSRTPDGRQRPNSERITRLGRLLRSTSIDETPELLNVIMGQMSLVGPRPLRLEYLDRYTPEQARRHEVKPGITGWAQVNGRNNLSWEDKFRLDVWYVDNWSLLLDLRIMLRTIATVFSRTGIDHSDAETMPEFLGTGKGTMR